MKSNFEEDIDLKNQFKIKNLPDPMSNKEPASKNYVDDVFRIDIDFNDMKQGIIKFVEVNYEPAIDSHLTPKIYVDFALDESSLVRNNQNKDSNNHILSIINSITLNTQAVNYNQVVTKAYVDQFHQENERARRDLGSDFYSELSDLVKNNQDDDLNDKFDKFRLCLC